MRVKKYVVDSMPDAMQLIRKDLGNNAVIINTKRVRKGGLFGLFGRNQIEVIAATDKDGKVDQYSQTRGSRHTQAKAAVNTSSVAHTTKHVHQPAVKTQHPNDELIQELKSMKSFMLKVMTEHEARLPEPIQKEMSLLKERGVTKELQAEISSNLLKRFEQQPDCTSSNVHSWIREEIYRYVAPSLRLPDQDARIKCFVGPTGVGKTTTIAKLAADLILNQKKKVGFITADTYRIAAVDQLKTYANILNAPIEIVFSPEDTKNAIDRLEDCDVILMDTAGRNYLQKQYIEDVLKLVSEQTSFQTFLVLSITSRIEDLEEILSNFKNLNVSGLIVTKVDETKGQGNLLNLITRTNIPITHLTNGQNVPDDILSVSPGTIADIIMGEDAHERPS